MERALNKLVQIKAILRSLRAQSRGPRQVYTNATVVLIFYWSVLNNQTRRWACSPDNWPLKRPPGGLPSPSQFSRRFREQPVQQLLDDIEREVNAIDPPPPSVCVAKVDARPLVIGNHSHDKHAGYGRAAGGKAKGYKLHRIIDACGRGLAWRIAPMNADERVMAKRMIRTLDITGYLLGDRNFDSNKLFGVAREQGLQMIVPRRYGADKGLAVGRHDPARLRSRDYLENTVCGFGRELFASRSGVERHFGTQASTPELLTHLPAWVRSRPRVYRYVQAKLVLGELHRIALDSRRKNTA